MNKHSAILKDFGLWQAVFVFSSLLVLLQFFNFELAFDRNAIKAGEFWRIWTANLVHLNWIHLVLNLGGLYLLVLLFYPYFSTWTFFISLFLLISGESLIIYFVTQGDHYLGLSSSLYGMYFFAACMALFARDYYLGIPVILLVLFKLAWDYYNPQANYSATLIGAPVAVDAHIYAVAVAVFLTVVYSTKFIKKARLS